MIKATAHSDDFVYEVEFDATAWFEQASAEDIQELIDCDWCCDRPADAVAYFFDGKNEDVTDMFKYIRRRGDQGFECIIDEESARAWLAAHPKPPSRMAPEARVIAVYDFLIPHLEDREEIADLVYLVVAILKGTKVTWPPAHTIVRLLKNGFNEPWVWQYIDIENT